MNFNLFLSVGRDPMSLISNYLSDNDLFNLSYVNRHTNETIKRGFIWNRHFKIIRTSICTLDFFELYNNNLARFCKHYCSEVNDYLKHQVHYGRRFAQLNDNYSYRRIFDPNTYKCIYELFKRSYGSYETKKLKLNIFEKKIRLDQFLKGHVLQCELDLQLTRAFAEDNLKSMQIWIEAGAKQIKVHEIPKTYDEVFFMKVEYLMRAGLIKKEEDRFLGDIISHGAAPEIIKKLLARGLKADDVSSQTLKASRHRLEILPLLLEAGLYARKYGMLHAIANDSENGHIRTVEGFKLLLQAGARADQELLDTCVSKNFPQEVIQLIALSFAKEIEDSSNELVSIHRLPDLSVSKNIPIEEIKQITSDVTKAIRDGEKAIALAFEMKPIYTRYRVKDLPSFRGMVDAGCQVSTMDDTLHKWTSTQRLLDLCVSKNFPQEIIKPIASFLTQKINEKINEFKEVLQYLKTLILPPKIKEKLDKLEFYLAL